MTTVSTPTIDERPEISYVGIRIQTPMKGMFKEIDKLRKQLDAWLQEKGIRPTGAPFLRYHVIDMEGEMDVAYCVPVERGVRGEGRVTTDVLPAGRYASLIYVGHGYTGNKTLVEWARAHGYIWDRWDDPKGDGFRARYERYLTDSKIEPRKTKWDVEVAIKLADEQPK
jgi:effector-binding domain-containing protein